jgi:hypothetical protein
MHVSKSMCSVCNLMKEEYSSARRVTRVKQESGAKDASRSSRLSSARHNLVVDDSKEGTQEARIEPVEGDKAFERGMAQLLGPSAANRSCNR